MNPSVSVIPFFQQEAGVIYPIIIKGRVFKYALPLHYPLPLKTTRLSARCGLIVELTDECGKVSYGEAAPLPDFSQELLVDVERELYQSIEILLGRSHESLIRRPSAAFAIESALWGLVIKQWQPKQGVAPLLKRGSIDEIQQKLVMGTWPDECKLKVARHSLDDDVKAVVNVLRILPDRVKLRLDANQRWTLDQGLSFYSALVKEEGKSGIKLLERIAYIEEPTANLNEFTEFYRKTGISYALDESLQQGRKAPITGQEGLRALVIKPTLTGGLNDCQTLVDKARLDNIRVIFSSAFESVVGLQWLQQLSACLTPEEMPGLDTSSAFADNIVETMPPPGLPLPDSAMNKMELLWEVSRA